MVSIRTSAALMALLAGQAGLAMADNIALRVTYADGRAGPTFAPVHAEVGKFAVTPNAHAGAEQAQWQVVARNAQGKVLHEVTVRNGLRRHVEVFHRDSGAIDIARDEKQAQGMFEVSMPYDKDTASIEVLPQPSANASKSLAAPGPLARFDRAALDAMVGQAKSTRSVASLAAAATATTIINTGPAASRMDYVFVGDGYTAAEMGKWRTDAQKVIDGFMADPLFAANRASMNVHRVDVASNQSGVDEIDRGIYRDTAMDGEFGCYNIDRLLCVNSTKVRSIVGSALAPDARDVIVVISNSTRYGGSGGDVATLSMNAQSVEVALHEIGHTAFALADEYEYGSCSTSAEPSEVNVSLGRTRSVKWGNLISASTAVPTGLGAYPNGTVGVFQGGQYCVSGKYRPTENSRMRTLGYPWHAVNEGAVKKVFAKYGGSGGTGATQTGTLSSGASVYAPSASPGYVQAGAGTISLQLTGAAGTDFDLFLFKSGSTGWVQVAKSDGPSSTEALSYNGTAGYYYVQVKSYAGNGAYTLKYTFPPK